MKRNTLACIVAIPVLILSACGASSTATSTGATGTSPSPSASAQGTPVVAVGTATVSGAAKAVLTNKAGLTLYYRSDEGPTTVKCTGACASNWPPLTLASGTPSASGSVSGTFTTFDTANGRQVLYNGHPLYTFVTDTGPGQATGEGKAGIWFVATPDLAAAM